MKKLLMFSLAAALFAAPAFSQDAKEKEKQEWESKLKTELALTSEQTVKYDAISTDFKTKVEGLKSDNTLTAAARDQRKMELKKEKEAKINEMLTPDQQTKFAALMKEKKDKMKKEKGK